MHVVITEWTSVQHYKWKKTPSPTKKTHTDNARLSLLGSEKVSTGEFWFSKMRKMHWDSAGDWSLEAGSWTIGPWRTMNISYSHKRLKKKKADYFNCLQGTNVWQREEGGLFYCPCQLSCKNLRIQRLYVQELKIRPVTVSKETLNRFTHGTGPVVSKLIIYCK